MNLARTSLRVIGHSSDPRAASMAIVMGEAPSTVAVARAVMCLRALSAPTFTLARSSRTVASFAASSENSEYPALPARNPTAKQVIDREFGLKAGYRCGLACQLDGERMHVQIDSLDPALVVV